MECHDQGEAYDEVLNLFWDIKSIYTTINVVDSVPFLRLHDNYNIYEGHAIKFCHQA